MLILVGSKGKEQGRAKNTKFAPDFTVLARYIIYSKPPTGVMDSLLLVVDYPKLLLIDFFIFKNLLLFYFPLMTRGSSFHSFHGSVTVSCALAVIFSL